MRDSARILMLLLLVQSLSIVHGRVVGRSEGGHGGGRGVCWGLFEGRPGHLVLHAQHLRAAIAGCAVVVVPSHQGGSRHGDAGVGHGDGGWSGHVLLLDMVQTQVVGTHRSRIHGWVWVRRGMGSGPRIGELRIAVLHIAVVDVVKTHPAVLAVLVLNDHRHGE